MRHPDVPEELRGKVAGLASPPIIRYLQDLGITAVELQRIHAFINSKNLLAEGLRNYWGYDTLSFLAPDTRYRAHHDPAADLHEVKEMVKALHAAGIEVILDISRGTVAAKERRPTARSSCTAAARCETSWPRWSCRRGRR
jgi:isoamylase